MGYNLLSVSALTLTVGDKKDISAVKSLALTISFGYIE